MKATDLSGRLRVVLGYGSAFFTGLCFASAVLSIFPGEVQADEAMRGQLFRGWFKKEAATAQINPSSLRTRLAQPIDDADRTRGRLDRLHEELLRVRRQAEDSRDIVLAGCLLPHEHRADELKTASNKAYNELMAGLTENDIGKISYGLEVFSILDGLEKQLVGQRDRCRGTEAVVYVDDGPHLPMPPPATRKAATIAGATIADATKADTTDSSGSRSAYGNRSNATEFEGESERLTPVSHTYSTAPGTAPSPINTSAKIR